MVGERTHRLDRRARGEKKKMVTQFFLAMRRRRVRRQEKQVRVVHGKPQFYEPQALARRPAQSCALTSGSTGRNSRIQAACGS